MARRYRDIIHRYYKDLFYLEHVVGLGYGMKEKNGRKLDEEAIVVLVDKKVPEASLRSKDMIPQKMENYETDVIEIGDIQLLNMRTQRMRPAQPGISIGHYKISAGTMGALVIDKDTGEPMILSNNHVLANITNGHDNRSEIKDPILQPGTYDGGKKESDVIGHLHRFIPIKRGGDKPTCQLAIAFERLINLFLHTLRPDYNLKLYKESYGNLVDCALAKPVNNDVVSNNILGLGKIRGVVDPEVGMKIKKSGRTSGITKGKIKLTSTTIQVRMSPSEVAVFHDQFVTEPMSEPGDSGSLVVNEDNDAVGLLFAGSEKATVCNWIKYVLDALKVKFQGE